MNAFRLLKPICIVAAILGLLFLVYQALLAFPQPLFPYHATYKYITIYSRSILPKSIDSILEKTDLFLSRSELYNPEKKSQIFICDSYSLFWFYTGGQKHVFAICFPHTTGYIFIPKVDCDHDLLLFEPIGPQDKRKRHFSNTLAHEITHSYIYDYLGPKAEIKLPNWIKEGYCEYIGQGDAIDSKEGFKHLLEGDTHMLGLFYFRSRRMIEMLIDYESQNIKEILSHPPNEEIVSKALMKKIQAQQDAAANP